MAFKLKTLQIIGLGGFGGDAASLTTQRMIARLCDRYANTDLDRSALAKSLQAAFGVTWIDSDEREATHISPAFALEKPETIEAPNGYRKLTSRSGKDILERIETRPYAYLKEYVEPRREFVAKKAEGAEAESVRGYGAIIGLENVEFIQRQVCEGIRRLEGFERTEDSQKLIRYGLLRGGEVPPLEIHCIGSTAGGQASGLFILVLGLLSLELREKLPRPKVHLHLAAPGFHPQKADVLARTQQLKTMAVLRDLAEVKQGDGELRIPHPAGTLTINSGSITFNSVNIYQPFAGERGQKYESFLSHFANTLAGSQLRAFAADLRRDKSNAEANARVLRGAAKRGAHLLTTRGG